MEMTSVPPPPLIVKYSDTNYPKNVHMSPIYEILIMKIMTIFFFKIKRMYGSVIYKMDLDK